MDENEILKQIRVERNKVNKKWRAVNKDKVRAYNKKYWRNRALKMLQEKVGEINE